MRLTCTDSYVRTLPDAHVYPYHTQDEFEMNMRLLGARTITEIVPSMVDASNIHTHMVPVPVDNLYDSNCACPCSFFISASILRFGPSFCAFLLSSCRHLVRHVRYYSYSALSPASSSHIPASDLTHSSTSSSRASACIQLNFYFWNTTFSKIEGRDGSETKGGELMRLCLFR